jgi:hypothetical protein
LKDRGDQENCAFGGAARNFKLPVKRAQNLNVFCTGQNGKHAAIGFQFDKNNKPTFCRYRSVKNENDFTDSEFEVRWRV